MFFLFILLTSETFRIIISLNRFQKIDRREYDEKNEKNIIWIKYPVLGNGFSCVWK